MSAVDLPTVRDSRIYKKARFCVERRVELKLKEATLLCEQLIFCVNKKITWEVGLSASSRIVSKKPNQFLTPN